MTPIAVVAIGAESALGSGRAAYSVGGVGDVAVTAIRAEEELRAAGLRKPFAAYAKLPRVPASDPAALLLERALAAAASELSELLPGWRGLRVAVSLGTSSGGMEPLTALFGRRARGEPISPELARAAPYFGPLARVEAVLGISATETAQVLAACASSAIAIGLGARWLEQRRADVVLAGGYDAVTPFVAAGFESLGATSATLPAPFRTGRDGMALGEAAVVFALVRAEDTASRVVGFLRGFGAACDAGHVTAPDRDGAGLARAARAALDDAALDAIDVDLVSAHATATPFNDAAEARALRTVLGAHVDVAVVHPFKAVVGHTLGASAALEAAAALDAMRRGVLPAAAGRGGLDPDARVRLLERNVAGNPRCALKLSAAFGGANAALVLATEPGRASPRGASPVELLAVGEPKSASDLGAIGSRTRMAGVQLSRMDPLSAATVAAAESALRTLPDLDRERTGVIVGTIAATLECNEVFDAPLRERGARGVEPRRFPPTSPNLCAGQCAIAFGLHGPSLAVGAGFEAPLEALLVAFDLIESGDADAMVVVAAEHVGPAVSDIFAAAGFPCPADGALGVVLGRAGGQSVSRPVIVAALREARDTRPSSGGAPGWPLLQTVVRSFHGRSGPP